MLFFYEQGVLLLVDGNAHGQRRAAPLARRHGRRVTTPNSFGIPSRLVSGAEGSLLEREKQPLQFRFLRARESLQYALRAVIR